MNWIDKFKQNLLEVLYDPNQPRDKKGRWTSGGMKSVGDGKGPGAVGRSSPETENEKQLYDNMKKFDSFMSSARPANDFKYQGTYAMVLEEGRWFDSSEAMKLPEGVPKGKMKECFMNAAKLAMDNKDYTYVEGFAMAKVIPELPIQHAWVVDKKGKVIDNTWKDGLAYFGIPFSTKYLMKTLRTTGVYGVIPELPMKKHNPVKNGFPEGAIIKTNILINAWNGPDENLKNHLLKVTQMDWKYWPTQQQHWKQKGNLENDMGR